VDNLNHKGAVFDQLWVHPVLLAVMHHYLGDFRLGAMTGRAPRPHTGHQRLHRDWQGAFEERYTACQSVWMLDDFNRATGTTRLIPGSHRFVKRPEEELDDPLAAHPDQVLIEAPRGSLAVFNGYIWHGGTENTRDRLRRGVFTFFARRDQPRSRDQRALLDQSTRSRLSPAACYVLDV
jgi:ectoine hydroxylase-related dioxygenase (phytanoyl-CoA dioxygenase family)